MIWGFKIFSQGVSGLSYWKKKEKGKKPYYHTHIWKKKTPTNWTSTGWRNLVDKPREVSVSREAWGSAPFTSESLNSFNAVFEAWTEWFSHYQVKLQTVNGCYHCQIGKIWRPYKSYTWRTCHLAPSLFDPYQRRWEVTP